MRILFVAGIAMLLVFCSCRKEHVASEQPTATIVIESPQPGQEFAKGASVSIRALITGDVSLHGYEVFVVDRHSADTVFKADNHTHAKELQVNEVWVDTICAALELNVYVRTDVNHEGASVARDVSIVTRP